MLIHVSSFVLINLALILSLFLFLSFIFFPHSHLFSSISPMIELTKPFGLDFFPGVVIGPSFLLIKTKLNLFFLIIFQLYLQLYSKLFLIFFLELNPGLLKLINYPILPQLYFFFLSFLLFYISFYYFYIIF